jgi:hypothetical protein
MRVLLQAVCNRSSDPYGRGARTMKMWRCSVCGYVHFGDVPPEKCPKCGAPAEKFVEIEKEKAALIERSAFTNGLLMELYTLLAKAAEVSARGEADNLDPGCVGIFKKAQADSQVLRRMIMAEVETHIGKGKW